MARKKRTLEAPDANHATNVIEPEPEIWNPAGTGSAPPTPAGQPDDPEAAELAELIAAIAAATAADSELEAIDPADWSR